MNDAAALAELDERDPESRRSYSALLERLGVRETTAGVSS